MINYLYRGLIIAALTLNNAISFSKPVDNWQLNMYKGVTPVSQDMYYLHNAAMVVCALIGLGVFGVMIYSLIYHRKSKNYTAASFHDNTKVEIIWSIIPFLILVGLAVPATKVLMRMNDTRDSQLTIKVVGSQWKWQYHYLDQKISYYSNLATPYKQIQNKEKKGPFYLLEVDKPLVLPINQKIRLLVTSQDVIHSWWVPELGVKRDAMPGYIYESWIFIEKPGTYRGQCTELCGINHAYMPIVVEAVSPEDFTKWLDNQNRTASTDRNKSPQNLSRADLMTVGKFKYEQICSACHQSNGLGIPPLYPALKGSSIAVGQPIKRHIDLILNGVPGSAMQGYREMLTDEDIAAIISYERNAWDNNTNDLVQPAEVALARQAENQTPILVNKVQAGELR